MRCVEVGNGVLIDTWEAEIEEDSNCLDSYHFLLF
jgi:hypothetical protein